MLRGEEKISDTLTHPAKRLEWIAGRILVKEVFDAMDTRFLGITKNEHGKPFPTGYDYHMSLSHSFPYVATLVDKSGPVGIDLEQPTDKLLRVAHRILHPIELKDAGSDLTKHCVYWCAKEALIKVHGEKNLFFSQNLLIDPFNLKDEGDLRGRIVINETERVIPLHYIVFPNFVLVFNQQTAP